MMSHNVVYRDVKKCPLCNSNNIEGEIIPIDKYRFGLIEVPLPKSGIKLIECAYCGLFYKDIVPTEESLLELFSTSASEVWSTKFYSFEKEINVLKAQIRKPVFSLIDVGSSDGGFLRSMSANTSMRSALDVYHDKRCQEVVTGEYLHTFIEAPNIKSSFRYDVVSVFDVFEHFYKPELAVGNCKNLLDVRGVIFGETGNTDAVARPSCWWYTHLIEHHIFWNINSFKYLANKLGLDIEYFEENAHKGRRYMPHLKRIVAFFLHCLSNFDAVGLIVRKFLSIDIKMIGNPYAKDHVMFVLRVK